MTYNTLIDVEGVVRCEAVPFTAVVGGDPMGVEEEFFAFDDDEDANSWSTGWYPGMDEDMMAEHSGYHEDDDAHSWSTGWEADLEPLGDEDDEQDPLPYVD